MKHENSQPVLSYGSLDSGKTFKWSEEAHAILAPLAEALHLQVNTVKDEQGNEVKLAGSYDLKVRRYCMLCVFAPPLLLSWVGVERHRLGY